LQKEKINGWYVASGRSSSTGNWRAWAKKTPLQCKCLLCETGEVFTESGKNRAEALDKLTKNDLTPFKSLHYF